MSYKIGFNKDSSAARIYEVIHANGVADQMLDRGYHDGKKIVGRADKKLDDVEIYQFALDHYETYRDIIKSSFGRPIPWELDDFNPTTHFDETVRKKTQTAIDFLKSLLQEQKIKLGSDEYNLKLAIGLFYFVDSPAQRDEVMQSLSFFNQRVSELNRVGLGGFKEYLIANGGLGTAMASGYTETEYTAIESIQLRRGKCSERSKILYAVYKMAGLNPHFVEIKWQDGKKAFEKVGERMEADFVGDNHVAVGINDGQSIRVFDLTLEKLTVKYDRFAVMDLPRAYAMDMANLASNLIKQGKHQQAKQFAQNAISVCPSFASGYEVFGEVLYYSRQDDEAIEAWSKAMTLLPSVNTYNCLGHIYIEHKDYAKAEKFLKQAVQFEPKFSKAHANLSKLYRRSGKNEESIREAKEAVTLNPGDAYAYEQLGLSYAIVERWQESVDAFQKSIQHINNNSDLYSNLGWAHFKLGQYDAAISAYIRSLVFNPRNEAAVNNLRLVINTQYGTNSMASRLYLDASIDVAEIAYLFVEGVIAWQRGEKNTFAQRLHEICNHYHSAKQNHPKIDVRQVEYFKSFLRELLNKSPLVIKDECEKNKEFKEILVSLGM